MKCEYCKNNYNKLIVDFYKSNQDIIDAYIWENSIEVQIHTLRDRISTISIPIKYCPMCGKKL